MLSNMPFFRRVARPMVTRPGYYVAALVIGLIGTATIDRGDALFSFYIGLSSLFVAFIAMRTVDDDQATETLEQLDVLPVPRWRMALETAAASVCGFGVLASFAAAVSALGVRGGWDFAFLFNQLPVIPALALLGTIVPLRHRMPRLSILVMVAIVTFIIRLAPDIQHQLSPRSTLAAFLMMPVKLGAWLALWAVLWKVAHLLGGGWSGGEAFRAPRRASACACPLSRGTPDSWNPLFWREIKMGAGWLVLIWLLGAAYLLAGLASDYKWDGPCARLGTCLGWMGFGLCMLSAMRTSRDRLSGMWADLAYTPLSLSAVLWCRVRGLGVQAGLMFIGWAGLAYAVDGRDAGIFSDVGAAVMLMASGYLACTLAGFCSGTSGRGVLAGIGGIFLMYFLVMVSMVPGGLLVSITSGHCGAPNPIAAALAVGLGVAMFYGTLIWASLRAIRQAAEEQRA